MPGNESEPIWPEDEGSQPDVRDLERKFVDDARSAILQALEMKILQPTWKQGAKVSVPRWLLNAVVNELVVIRGITEFTPENVAQAVRSMTARSFKRRR